MPNTNLQKNKMDLVVEKYLRYFVSNVMGLKNADFHDDLDNVLSDDFYRAIVIAYARDHGKTTHLSIAYPLWEIAKNHNLRILLISSTSGIASSFMTEIVGHIDKNETYKRWAKVIDPNDKGVIPQFKGNRKANEKWSGSSIIIDREDLNLKDPTINAVGLFGSILSKRADIIILDDLVNQVNSMTEDQRLKVIDWFYTTILPVLVPGGRVIYLGNTWHQDDLVSRLMKDPQFDYRKKRAAIIHESNHVELWNEWVKILLDESIPTAKDRKIKAEEYYQSNKTLMDDGVQVLWPERYHYKDLFLKRFSNPYAFARMYMCDPSNRPNQKIKDEWVEEALRKGKGFRFQRTPHAGIVVSTFCSGLDLAISEKDSADDTALLTLDKILYGNGDTVKDGDFIIRNIVRGHLSPNEVREMLRDHSQNDKPDGIRVETVGYQESIKRDMEDMGIPVTGYHTGGEKNDPDVGVNSIAILMELGKFIIPSDPTDPYTVKLALQLANEMRAFPDGHTGDSLMALWFALSEIRDRSGDGIIIPSAKYVKDKEVPDLTNPETRKDQEKKADQATIEKQHERDVFRQMMTRRR